VQRFRRGRGVRRLRDRLKIKSCRFQRSVYRSEDEPRTTGPDVVFLGRSNVGKSSLINRLLGTKKLAKTSSQPGKTQSVNFYRVNESFHFVDLPGYGYARVPESVRNSWAPLVENFLRRRRDRIALALLVVDARRAPTALDATMRSWLADAGIPYVVVATKADKLAAGARATAVREIEESLGGRACVPASATTGLGTREIWRYLDGALVRTAGPAGRVESSRGN